MLPERGEQKRSVIFDPKFAFARVDVLGEPVLTFFEDVRLLEVFLREPVLISPADPRVSLDPVALDAEEKVDGGLLVGVCEDYTSQYWRKRVG
jgi:hypothetical protein